MNRLALRFDSPDDERRFRRTWARSARRTSRATFAIVAALFVVWVGLDYAVLPDLAGRIVAIRAPVVLVVLAALATTWSHAWPRFRSWSVAAASLACAGGLMAMLALAPERLAAPTYAGIGIIVFGTCSLFRLRTPVAAAIAGAAAVGYVVAAIVAGLPVALVVPATFTIATALGLGALAAWNIEHYARLTWLREREVEEERERAERLLLNILPAPVAERLKREPGPIAERFEAASVLFADICDFTTLSSTMEPEALVSMLNEVFTEFDHICRAYGIEKIKTIGDAYMAVAGVPVPVADHLDRVAGAALAMRDAILARAARPDGAPLAIRIGIDSGPVVAGVIGESKFIYDLWGDVVTTASRMESQGVIGEVQVSERVLDALAGTGRARDRGTIDVKGKGAMRVGLLDPA